MRSAKILGLEELLKLNFLCIEKSVDYLNTKYNTIFLTFQAKKGGQGVEEMPDLNAKDVQDAALKIQSAFRGHQVRGNRKKPIKKNLPPKGEEMPDLEDKGEYD